MDKNTNQRIILNVSGTIFETMSQTLDCFPDTLLGSQKSRDQFYSRGDSCYYLNRNSICFESILFFYQSKGRLYRPPNIPIKFFLEECIFFRIPDCALFMFKTHEREFLREKIRQKHFPPKQNNSIQMWLWNTLENPGSNVGGSIFFCLQMSAIFLSVSIICHESYKPPDQSKMSETQFIIEVVLSSWFFLETSLRAILAPNKTRFFTSVLNWCDIVAVGPYTIIYSYHRDTETKFLNQSRFIRVLRILRLRKISPRAKAVCLIFKDSFDDLVLFFFGLFLAIVFGSATIYYLEMSNHTTDFTSIPASMWWAVQTFLTVGYGDMVPQTIPGRIFSTVFMVIGLDTVLLPVLSLIMKFADFVAADYPD